ncbi:MAG TPA: DivIVA domain-containing protein [Gaiellaceae bacterium]|nr:DivIVA domain-containing protein [Gaiellaceae bacterium]
MPYTPVELRHVRLGRALFGYRREETQRLLDDVADSFEDVWRDRGELADKVEDLERTLEEFKQREHLLSQTLVAAERSAAEAREAARREAELIVAEAHQEARSVMRGAQRERERLVSEARRVATLLRSALGFVEESLGERSDDDAWPTRYDTREFAAIRPDDEEEAAAEGPGDEAPADQAAPEQPEAGAEPEDASGAEPEPEEAPSRDFNWG